MSADLDAILDELATQRLLPCGYCAGTGSRWSIEFQRMERCVICRGRRRGTVRVWNGGPKLRRRAVVDYGE